MKKVSANWQNILVIKKVTWKPQLLYGIGYKYREWPKMSNKEHREKNNAVPQFSFFDIKWYGLYIYLKVLRQFFYFLLELKDTKWLWHIKGVFSVYAQWISIFSTISAV